MTDAETRRTATTAAASTALDTLKQTLGLLAGVAALVYITGGAVLGLRLLFADIPSLAVVGQLPRDFLFSIGATQVIGPAVLIGAAVGVIELGQSERRLRLGHLPWWRVKDCPGMRRTYVWFYAVVPVVLIAPGAAYALTRAHGLHHRLAGLISAGALIAAGALILLWSAWRSGVSLTAEQLATQDRAKRAEEAARAKQAKLAKKGEAVEKAKQGKQVENAETAQKVNLAGVEWPLLVSGLALCLATAGWVAADDDWAFFGLAAAWVISLLVVLLVTWLRGVLGERSRRPDANGTMLTVLSWAATALLAVPMLVALDAALPLQRATICGKGAGAQTYRAAGRFVGETNDRVYLGDDIQHRIVSIPAAEVARVILGRNATHTGLCNHSTTGPP